MKQFEYVIAGAGAAGLTLAYLLLKGNNNKKSILIIDKDSKSSNDRTWCFWEKGPNLLENLVYHSWNHGLFQSTDFNSTFDLAPYRYKMIRGVDFYSSMKQFIHQHAQVKWIQDEVKSIDPDGVVHLSSESVKGHLVFDSTPSFRSFAGIEAHNLLLQHFKGYFIETSTPHFKPEQFTYMDLNIAQEGDFRFGYVLPFSENRALVEYTIFNEHLLDEEEYEKALKHYIGNNLNISDYTITEEEYGIIPMTDYPFQLKLSDHHYRIGISGGFAKPSTGYTFLRSQKILSKMVENLNQGLPPESGLPYQQKRFKKYDSTLLRVLAKENNKGRQAFSSMFRKNGMSQMFRFLDEETTLTEELAIMSSTPLLTFGKAFFQSISQG